jgi:hypothetical protein
MQTLIGQYIERILFHLSAAGFATTHARKLAVEEV